MTRVLYRYACCSMPCVLQPSCVPFSWHFAFAYSCTPLAVELAFFLLFGFWSVPANLQLFKNMIRSFLQMIMFHVYQNSTIICFTNDPINHNFCWFLVCIPLLLFCTLFFYLLYQCCKSFCFPWPASLFEFYWIIHNHLISTTL